MFVFDPEVFDTETAEEIAGHKAWLEHAGWQPEMARQSLRDMQNERALLRVWSENFSGKVPESWGQEWYNISMDVRNLQVELSLDMTEAAASYPFWQVPMVLGVSRILSDMQVEVIRQNPTMVDVNHPHALEDMVQAQERLQVAHKKITT